MEQMQGKTKTTYADHWKRYREKNKINDVLRKKRTWKNEHDFSSNKKSNKDAYEEHKKKEKEKKRLGKHRKVFAINYPHMDQDFI